MDILERYQNDLNTGLIHDPVQAAAVEKLHNLGCQLCEDQASKGFLKRFFFSGQSEAVRGLYLWGGVGRGKTYLMDLFFQTLNIKQKQRLHFHRFMQQVHHDLKAIKGRAEPLQIIANEWAERTKVLCLDEFFVTDIGDAMILAGLLKALFEHDITLVTTSNIAPANLYQDGLQRESFLPAITLLEDHCEILELDSAQDYRLRALTASKMYYIEAPGDHETLKARFAELSARGEVSYEAVDLFGRLVPIQRRCEGVAWFDFSALCEGPRHVTDYIEIARQFHTVLLGDVPVFTAKNDDAARRFLHLVDEFYDRKVKLIISAAIDLFSLYQGERLVFEFERVISRLQEMQSEEYLKQAHLP